MTYLSSLLGEVATLTSENYSSFVNGRGAELFSIILSLLETYIETYRNEFTSASSLAHNCASKDTKKLKNEKIIENKRSYL